MPKRPNGSWPPPGWPTWIPRARRRSSTALVEARAPAGVTLLEQDQPNDHLTFLIDGTAEIHRTFEGGRREVITTIAAPSVFGTTSFFRPDPPSVGVRATSDVWMLSLYHPAHEALRRQNPRAAEALAVAILRALPSVRPDGQAADRLHLAARRRIAADVGMVRLPGPALRRAWALNGTRPGVRSAERSGHEGGRRRDAAWVVDVRGLGSENGVEIRERPWAAAHAPTRRSSARSGPPCGLTERAGLVSSAPGPARRDPLDPRDRAARRPTGPSRAD